MEGLIEIKYIDNKVEKKNINSESYAHLQEVFVNKEQNEIVNELKNIGIDINNVLEISFLGNNYE